MNKFSILIIIFTFTITSNILAQKKNYDDLDLGAMITCADTSLFFKDADYYNWCSSIIKDDNDKYHLFYSRWPKKYSYNAWLTHSEIAHAWSDTPYGPFKDNRTIMTGDRNKWCSIMAHNVQVNRFSNKYYMYFISTNSGDEHLTQEQLIEIAKVGGTHPQWALLRNNQRIGLAYSDNLNGLWEIKEEPLLEPDGPIKTLTTNPSICQKDSIFYLIAKGDDVTTNYRKLIQSVSLSKSPCGPFNIQTLPAFSEIATEDVYIWYDKERERFYAIFHAHCQNFIGLITSTDGVNWKKANNYIVCRKEIKLKDGKIMKVDRMERPFVFIEDGKPKVLSFGVKKGNDAFIVFYPLKEN